MVQRPPTAKLSSCDTPERTEEFKNGMQPFESHAILICMVYLFYAYFASSKINTIVYQIDKYSMVQIWSLKFIKSILDVISWQIFVLFKIKEM